MRSKSATVSFCSSARRPWKRRATFGGSSFERREACTPTAAVQYPTSSRTLPRYRAARFAAANATKSTRPQRRTSIPTIHASPTCAGFAKEIAPAGRRSRANWLHGIGTPGIARANLRSLGPRTQSCSRVSWQPKHKPGPLLRRHPRTLIGNSADRRLCPCYWVMRGR